MPIPPMDEKQIKAFSKAFEGFQVLSNNGFSFLIDISGSLFKGYGRCSLKDLEGNIEAGCIAD